MAFNSKYTGEQVEEILDNSTSKEDTLNLMAIALLAANNGECSIFSDDNWKFAIIDTKNNLLIGKKQKTDKWEIGCSPNIIMNALLDLNSFVSISQKADKATTIAGYGIEDAKIENGHIILGNNSLFPVVHGDLYNMTILSSMTSIGISSYINNEEWNFVIVDSNDLVLFGKRHTGGFYICENFDSIINELLSNISI